MKNPTELRKDLTALVAMALQILLGAGLISTEASVTILQASSVYVGGAVIALAIWQACSSSVTSLLARFFKKPVAPLMLVLLSLTLTGCTVGGAMFGKDERTWKSPAIANTTPSSCSVR